MDDQCTQATLVRYQQEEGKSNIYIFFIYWFKYHIKLKWDAGLLFYKYQLLFSISEY